MGRHHHPDHRHRHRRRSSDEGQGHRTARQDPVTALRTVGPRGSRPWRPAAPAARPADELVSDALRAAAATRGGALTGAIFHSDHGAQYTSAEFAAVCRQLGVRQSMGAVGTSADNALAEALNATLKRETLQGARCWPSARPPGGLRRPPPRRARLTPPPGRVSRPRGRAGWPARPGADRGRPGSGPRRRRRASRPWTTCGGTGPPAGCGSTPRPPARTAGRAG